MKGYILKRLLQSVVSIFIVTTITFVMVYSCIPRHLVFKGDQQVQKLGSKPDEQQHYKYTVWKRLGYVQYTPLREEAVATLGAGTEAFLAAVAPASEYAAAFRTRWEAKGWTVEEQPVTGLPYAWREVPLLTRVFRWFARMFEVDHPWRIRDPENPSLKRGYRWSRDWSGRPALVGSGTRFKYQLWFDGRFPFIHSNALKLNMGLSYPTYDGQEVIQVIAGGQGRTVKRQVRTTVDGEPRSFFSSIDEHSLEYKPVLDHLDLNKYPDHYAKGRNIYEDPSMLATSFIMGTAALLISLIVGIFMGVYAAMKKDGLFDKGVMAYTVFMNAIPTLLYIALFARFGMLVLGLPDKFPFLGSRDLRSWVMPVLSLALGGIAGEALWIRRYMVDQVNSDYVKFARSKGLSQSEVFFRHILRNALIPIVHGIPMAVVLTLTGAVITESFYAVPGMGKMVPASMWDYNNSMLVALTFIFTVVSILAVFAGDILVTLVDPRISLQARKEAR